MIFTAPVPPGQFLFLFKPQQIPHRYAKVVGDLVGGSSSEVLFAAGFQIGNDPSADTDVGAQLAWGNAPLRAELLDLVI